MRLPRVHNWHTEHKPTHKTPSTHTASERESVAQKHEHAISCWLYVVYCCASRVSRRSAPHDNADTLPAVGARQPNGLVSVLSSGIRTYNTYRRQRNSSKVATLTATTALLCACPVHPFHPSRWGEGGRNRECDCGNCTLGADIAPTRERTQVENAGRGF